MKVNVYSKDLNLFIEDEERIGDIVVLDKYS